MIGLIVSAAIAVSTPTESALERIRPHLDALGDLQFAIGVCDGFVDPVEVAPYDPYGPLTEGWPRQLQDAMAHLRDEGQAEMRRLRYRLTYDERVELCERMIDDAEEEFKRANESTVEAT